MMSETIDRHVTVREVPTLVISNLRACQSYGTYGARNRIMRRLLARKTLDEDSINRYGRN